MHTSPDMPRIAVVGGGIAGMGAAYALQLAGVHVTVFDRELQLGGDVFGVTLHGRDGSLHPVDSGFSDFNASTFTTFERFLGLLGVERRPISREAGFLSSDQHPLYFVTDEGRFTFWKDVPDAAALQAEYARFRLDAAELLDDPARIGQTAGEFLREGNYSAEFIKLFFMPRAKACFAMHEGNVEEFPMRTLAAFWRMHAIIGSAMPDRRCVVGGTAAYCSRFVRGFQEGGGVIKLGAEVFAVRRQADGAALRWMGETGPTRQVFDHVVLAAKPSDLLAVIEDASPREARLMGVVPYRRDHVVIHTDERILPRSKRAWGAINLTVDGETRQRHPRITYWQNRLAELDSRLPNVFVTLNPARELARDKVIASRYMLHPVGSRGALWGENEWAEIQGRDRLWFCGSFMEAPFLQENALRSGMQAARELIEKLQADGCAVRELAAS